MILEGSAVVDGLTVDGQPLAQSDQSLLKDGADGALLSRADVDQDVAIAADDFGDGRHHFIDRHDFGQVYVAPVAPRSLVQCEGIFKLVRKFVARIEPVRPGIISPVLLAGARAPPERK